MKIGYTNDQSLNEQVTQGSDGRLNVSARADGRRYYNSRDKRESYSLKWEDASTESGDFVIYWKNTDTNGRHLVVSDVGLNSILGADFELCVVTGDATGGASATPVCLNRAAPLEAQATARTAVSDPILNITASVCIDHESVPARGHNTFELQDTLRIPQGGAVAIRCVAVDSGPGRTFGVMYGFYE